MASENLNTVTTRHFPARLVLLVLAVLLAVVFYRLWLGETFFWGLPALQFYPWREYAFDLLRAGHLPLWNPYNGAGAPLLANYQSALLYPLNWLGLVLPLAWSMSVTAVLHLFIAGWGMWAFTGRLGLPPLGRGISALAFGLTGYLVARLGTYPTITTAAWMPWILWAALGVLMHFRRRDVAWLALFAGLQLLAGHAQTTWYSMLLVALFTVWWSIGHRPIDWRRPALVIAGLTLGAGIAAAQLLPTGELLLQSQRSGGLADYDFVTNYSYSLARTFNLLSPNVFGNPGDGSYISEKGAFFEDAVYIGLLPLVSALAAVVFWAWGKLRRHERPAYFASVPFWLLIVIIAFLLALGKNGPIFPFLYRSVPTFALFQGPVRWHIWTALGLSVLAGIGVGAWGYGHWLFFGTRLAIAGCIGAAVLALISPNFLPPSVTGQEGVQVIIRAVVYTGIFGALAGALTLLQPETERWYGLWAFTVLAVIAADLGYAAWGLNPTVPASFYNQRQPSRDTRAYWPKDATDKVQFDTYLPFDDYTVAVQKQDAFRASGLPNLNLLDREPLLNNFDPLLVGGFSNYIKLMEDYPDQRDRLLQAAGVAAIYDENGEFQPLIAPAPRAWFVSEVCRQITLPGSGPLDPGWQPQKRTYLYPVGTGGDCPLRTYDNPGNVLDIQENGDVLTVKVDAPADGLLVVADTAYPGWTASVDGKPVDIQLANVNFRAVDVPAGAQTVEFRYQPVHWLLGCFISLASVLGLLVLFRSKNPNVETAPST
jgi:hypothetical protein